MEAITAYNAAQSRKTNLFAESVKFSLASVPHVADAKEAITNDPRCAVASGITTFTLPTGVSSFMVTQGMLVDTLYADYINGTVISGDPVARQVILVKPLTGSTGDMLRPLNDSSANPVICMGSVIPPVVRARPDIKPVEFLQSCTSLSLGAQTTTLVSTGGLFSAAVSGPSNSFEMLGAVRSEMTSPIGAYEMPFGNMHRYNLVPFNQRCAPTAFSDTPTLINPGQSAPLYLTKNTTTYGSALSWGVSNGVSGCANTTSPTTTSEIQTKSFCFSVQATQNTDALANPFLFNCLTPTMATITISGNINASGSAVAGAWVNLPFELYIQAKVPYADMSGATNVGTYSWGKRVTYVRPQGTNPQNNTGTCLVHSFHFPIPPFATQIIVAGLFKMIDSGNTNALNFEGWQFSMYTEGYQPTLRPALMATGLAPTSQVTLSLSSVLGFEPTPTDLLLFGETRFCPEIAGLAKDLESLMSVLPARKLMLRRPGESPGVELPAEITPPTVAEVSVPTKSGTFLAALGPVAGMLSSVAGSILPKLAPVLGGALGSLFGSGGKAADGRSQEAIDTLVEEVLSRLQDRMGGRSRSSIIPLTSESAIKQLKALAIKGVDALDRPVTLYPTEKNRRKDSGKAKSEKAKVKDTNGKAKSPAQASNPKKEPGEKVTKKEGKAKTAAGSKGAAKSEPKPEKVTKPPAPPGEGTSKSARRRRNKAEAKAGGDQTEGAAPPEGKKKIPLQAEIAEADRRKDERNKLVEEQVAAAKREAEDRFMSDQSAIRLLGRGEAASMERRAGRGWGSRSTVSPGTAPGLQILKADAAARIEQDQYPSLTLPVTGFVNGGPLSGTEVAVVEIDFYGDRITIGGKPYSCNLPYGGYGPLMSVVTWNIQGCTIDYVPGTSHTMVQHLNRSWLRNGGSAFFNLSHIEDPTANDSGLPGGQRVKARALGHSVGRGRPTMPAAVDQDPSALCSGPPLRNPNLPKDKRVAYSRKSLCSSFLPGSAPEVVCRTQFNARTEEQMSADMRKGQDARISLCELPKGHMVLEGTCVDAADSDDDESPIRRTVGVRVKMDLPAAWAVPPTIDPTFCTFGLSPGRPGKHHHHQSYRYCRYCETKAVMCYGIGVAPGRPLESPSTAVVGETDLQPGVEHHATLWAIIVTDSCHPCTDASLSDVQAQGKWLDVGQAVPTELRVPGGGLGEGATYSFRSDDDKINDVVYRPVMKLLFPAGARSTGLSIEARLWDSLLPFQRKYLLSYDFRSQINGISDVAGTCLSITCSCSSDQNIGTIIRLGDDILPVVARANHEAEGGSLFAAILAALGRYLDPRPNTLRLGRIPLVSGSPIASPGTEGAIVSLVNIKEKAYQALRARLMDTRAGRIAKSLPPDWQLSLRLNQLSSSASEQVAIVNEEAHLCFSTISAQDLERTKKEVAARLKQDDLAAILSLEVHARGIRLPPAIHDAIHSAVQGISEGGVELGREDVFVCNLATLPERVSFVVTDQSHVNLRSFSRDVYSE